MNIEDRLRNAITHRTDRVEPAPDSLAKITEALDHPTAGHGRPGPDRRRLIAVGTAAAAILLVGAAVFATSRNDGTERVETEPPASSPGGGTTPTTPGTVGPTASTNPGSTLTTGTGSTTTVDPGMLCCYETSTSTAPATSGPQNPVNIDAAQVVWPRPQDTGLRFDDPVEAARSFAIQFAGFTDPQVGPFQPGDSMSGEVAVRAAISTDSPSAVTTVHVRKMADGHWWVVASSNPDIQLTNPSSGSTIVCDGTPTKLTGTALAFEGHVNVRLIGFALDGSPRTIGEGIVMGAGTPPAMPFNGEINCDLRGATTQGVLSYLTLSARDGSVWQYVAVPVRFVVG